MSNVQVGQMKLMMTKFKAIIESDRHVTVQETEEILKTPKSTIDRHIQYLELVKKLDIWIPHELKEIHLTKRFNACDLHLNRNEFDPFLKRIITGDEKWIVYNNVVRKRSWSKRDQKLNCIKKRLCCLFGGIGKVWYFLNCFQGTNR